MKWIKSLLRPSYNAWKRRSGRRRAMRAAGKSPLKIVVGSGEFHDKGWVPTDIEYLNMLNPNDWSSLFKPNSIDAILGEHVWEHITLKDGETAARFCHQYLKPGGYLRIAVPDGFHPDPGYIEYVKVGGTGPGADDHKVLYTYKSITEMLERAGFTVRLLEYFDENGTFRENPWSKEQGTIHRSKTDPRNTDGKLNYTSLIVDAVKQ